MSDRPDLRKIAVDIREALGSYPKEALVDILTYVFQAYVVEGTPAVKAAEPDRLPSLEGLSFAEVVQALQARLDVPELALFEVQGGRVHVRAGGQLVPLTAVAGPSPAMMDTPAAAPPAVAAAAAPAPAPAAERPRPGVRVEETVLPQRPQPAVAAEAPRPARGLSVGGRPAPTPSGGGAPASTPTAPVSPAAAQPGAPKEEKTDDDASTRRYRNLEID